MKKKLINILIMGFVFANTLQGQFEITPDPDYTPYYYLKDTKIPVFDSDNLFELRVWISVSHSRGETLFRIQYTKDSIWKADKYSFFYKKTKVYRRKDKQYKNLTEHTKIKLSDSWNTKFDTLKQLGVLTLPTWYSVLDGLENANKVSLGIFDGTSYHIELLTDENKRSYEYHCPQTFLSFYKQSPELESIIGILKIIFREFNYLEPIAQLQQKDLIEIYNESKNCVYAQIQCDSSGVVL